jgi:hypothetical protein
MITCNPDHLLPWIKVMAALAALAVVCVVQALCIVLPALALLWAILLR